MSSWGSTNTMLVTKGISRLSNASYSTTHGRKLGRRLISTKKNITKSLEIRGCPVGLLLSAIWVRIYPSFSEPFTIFRQTSSTDTCLARRQYQED
jgi:hypothetical protein